jgi:hypothetical protein
MKISVVALKQLIRESLKEMGMKEMSEEQRKAMLASEYSDVYKEKNGIRPRWLNWKEMSVEELERKLEDIHAEPDMMDDDYSDEEASELKRMQEPEEGEEHPKHLGMGHHLHETIKLMVSEVLEEAKAKKYKGKSMRKGGGDRFAKLDDKLKASGKKRAAKK